MSAGPWVKIECPQGHRVTAIRCGLFLDAVEIEWWSAQPDYGDIRNAGLAVKIATQGWREPQNAVELLSGPREDERPRFDCQQCRYNGVRTKAALIGLYRDAVIAGQTVIRLQD